MNHYHRLVEGWFRAEFLYKAMVEEAPATGAHFVEVGAWKGQSAAYMGVEIANSGKQIKFDVVDWFKGSDEPAHHADPDVRDGRLFDVFMQNTDIVRRFIKPIVSSSIEAAALYPDHSLDFVFLDAGHDYDSVRADILAWLPKIKPGKMLAGDDMDVFPGVRQAVTELLPGFAYPVWPTWTYRTT